MVTLEDKIYASTYFIKSIPCNDRKILRSVLDVYHEDLVIIYLYRALQ